MFIVETTTNKLETTQISYSGQMIEQTVVHSHHGLLLLNNKKGIRYQYMQQPE